MRKLPVCLSVASIGLVGCVPEPMVFTIRVRPEIAAVEERVLSLQLVTPTAAAPERVICHGVYTAALLEDSEDTLDDFLLGYVTPKELKKGDVRLIVQESGQSHIVRLQRERAGACKLNLSVTVPDDLSDIQATWSPKD